MKVWTPSHYATWKLSLFLCLAKLVCACSVAQPCSTLCNPMDCNLPGSSVHGNFQARILEQVAISYSSPSPGIKSVLPVFPALAGNSLPLSHHSPFFFFFFQPSTTVLLMVSEASMIWPLDHSDPITHPLQPHWTVYCSSNPSPIHLL